MRVLLSEGSGLTSRQVAGLLVAGGHQVGVVSANPIGLTRFTRGLGRWHRVVPFGSDPARWLDHALEIYHQYGYDVLFPTQEQVAVLASRRERLSAEGVATVVPGFVALTAVQDKIAARATLEQLGIPQPSSTLLTARRELETWNEFPVYLKSPIGTATSGVHRLDTASQRDALVSTGIAEVAFADGGFVAQSPAIGPLAMVQSVFDRGRMVAFHLTLRVREGARGGASHKRSRHAPDVRLLTEHLGASLSWHGALSLDVILTGDGPSVIDVNPRLVEPVNAHLSGVDLVSAMLDLARGARPRRQLDGQEDVRTHQLLLAVLGAVQHHRGRRGVAYELWSAAARRSDYRMSTEELLPRRTGSGQDDWRSPIPVLAAAATTLLAPRAWQWFASSSVSHYSLTPQGWAAIKAGADPGGGVTAAHRGVLPSGDHRRAGPGGHRCR